mmetsp:Transcript_31215/g.95455  ORF Transcript_31215/g.95455 Transcript_31215/m.95455 type:complete len:316 (+) Transcript_31215:260-1207(+)|eukprot:scaffold199137_cov32-Tisochrysis_lutea.AAC.4
MRDTLLGASLRGVRRAAALCPRSALEPLLLSEPAGGPCLPPSLAPAAADRSGDNVCADQWRRAGPGLALARPGYSPASPKALGARGARRRAEVTRVRLRHHGRRASDAVSQPERLPAAPQRLRTRGADAHGCVGSGQAGGAAGAGIACDTAGDNLGKHCRLTQLTLAGRLASARHRALRSGADQTAPAAQARLCCRACGVAPAAAHPAASAGSPEGAQRAGGGIRRKRRPRSSRPVARRSTRGLVQSSRPTARAAGRPAPLGRRNVWCRARLVKPSKLSSRHPAASALAPLPRLRLNGVCPLDFEFVCEGTVVVA